MAEAAATDVAKMTFEAALAELESIVQKLERGDVALEDSIRIYERGAALKAHCEGRLKAAQMRVEQIVIGGDGTPGTKPFET
jgi:exodeoxyribonuclease VII small subunit